jgi:tRNA (mo5U34)-methyltransferase
LAFDRSELQNMAASVGYWFHSIDFGQGVVTQGIKSAKQLSKELAKCALPNLVGKSVLDIGGIDGYFAFAAERLGAARVVVLDYHTWSLDLPKYYAHYLECKQRGIVPKEFEASEHWRPNELPGKKGFDTACEARSSKVESKVADFMEVDLETLGTFDVVLYLGVLYHMKHPLLSLQRLARVTREVAIIETEAVVVPWREHIAMCEFYETNELNGDVSNWWTPNAKALAGMCRAAGFREVRLTPIIGSRVHQALRGLLRPHYRLFAQAFK